MKNNSIKAHVELKEGVIYISGDMRFSTVMMLDDAAKRLFDSVQSIVLDFSKVHSSDSSALALIVGWLRAAKHCKKTIELKSLPSNLEAIASASGISELLLSD